LIDGTGAISVHDAKGVPLVVLEREALSRLLARETHGYSSSVRDPVSKKPRVEPRS
jgi:hypothetical protein